MQKDKLGEFRTIFRESLSVQLRLLKEAHSAHKNGDLDATEDLRKIARDLRRTAGRYGFPEISRAGNELELASGDAVNINTQLLVKIIENSIGTTNSTKTNVLILSHDTKLASSLFKALEKDDRKISVFLNAREGQDAIQQTRFELIILDVYLPERDGREILRDLRQKTLSAAVPIIIIGNGFYPVLETECLAHGADAYINSKEHIEDILKTAESFLAPSKLNRLSHIDELTNLPNRAYLGEVYTRTISRSERTGKPFAIALIEIDKFYSIKDVHGTSFVSDIITRIADNIQNSLRKYDFAARVREDQIVILFPDTSAELAIAVVNRIQENIFEESFTSPGDQLFKVQVSAGIQEIIQNTTLEKAISGSQYYLMLANLKGTGEAYAPCFPASMPGKSVMFMGSDGIMAELINQALNKEKLEHTWINRYGIAEVTKSLPDILILDLSDPMKKGFDVLKTIRKQKLRKEVPILALVEKGYFEDVNYALDAGVDDYIFKPFISDLLAQRVIHLLKKHIKHN